VRLYVIDNGCDWSDHAIYFVGTDKPLSEVQKWCEIASSGSSYETYTVCGHGKEIEWLNDIIWSKMSLEQFIEDNVDMDILRALKLSGEVCCGRFKDDQNA
jgi:hypothetical protein